MAAGATREVDSACCFADRADGNAEDMIIVLWTLLRGPAELPPATLVLESVEAAFAFATGLRGPGVEALDAFFCPDVEAPDTLVCPDVEALDAFSVGLHLSASALCLATTLSLA